MYVHVPTVRRTIELSYFFSQWRTFQACNERVKEKSNIVTQNSPTIFIQLIPFLFSLKQKKIIIVKRMSDMMHHSHCMPFDYITYMHLIMHLPLVLVYFICMCDRNRMNCVLLHAKLNSLAITYSRFDILLFYTFHSVAHRIYQHTNSVHEYECDKRQCR